MSYGYKLFVIRISLLWLPKQNTTDRWLKQQKFILLQSECWKSKIRVPAQSGSDESILACKWPPFPLSTHGGCQLFLPLPTRAPALQDQCPTLMTSFNIYHLPKVLFLNTLGVRASTYVLEIVTSIQSTAVFLHNLSLSYEDMFLI